MGVKEEDTVATSSGAGDQLYPPPYYQYGTFQGVAHCNRPPTQNPVSVLPQVAPPPGSAVPPYGPYHYVHGYHAIPVGVGGYAVAEVRPFREPRLPCCGIGIGWFLFIAGFFFAVIPWYVGAFILLFIGVDYREKAGLVACLVASILSVIAIALGATQGADQLAKVIHQ